MKVEVKICRDYEKILVDGKAPVAHDGEVAQTGPGDAISCSDVAGWMQQAYQAGTDEGAGNFTRVPDKVCQTMGEFNAEIP